MVVCISNGILFLVSKLDLNDVAVKVPFQFLFTQDGGEHGSETVNGYFFLAEAHSADAAQQCQFGNAL